MVGVALLGITCVVSPSPVAGVVGVGCLYRLHSAVDGVDGCRLLHCNVQPVRTAQCDGVDSIRNGIAENEEVGKVVPVVVPDCVSFTFRRSTQNACVKHGADVASDHYLLIAKLELKLKRNWAGDSCQRPRYDTTMLLKLKDITKQEQLKTVLLNKSQVLG